MQLRVAGMTCSSCSSAVENALLQVKGVTSASVNVLTGVAVVDFTSAACGPRDLLEAVDSAGFAAQPLAGVDQCVCPTLVGVDHFACVLQRRHRLQVHHLERWHSTSLPQ